MKDLCYRLLTTSNQLEFLTKLKFIQAKNQTQGMPLRREFLYYWDKCPFHDGHGNPYTLIVKTKYVYWINPLFLHHFTHFLTTSQWEVRRPQISLVQKNVTYRVLSLHALHPIFLDSYFDILKPQKYIDTYTKSY